MKTFLIIWAGQFVSRVGTALTRFALLIWLYRQTESPLAVALLGFFAFLPAILVSPLAGVWVDRLSRRTVMLVADTAAAVTTLALLLLYATGSLAVWHLYVVALLTGSLDAFQSPAYMAAVSLLLPKEQYGRAAGLRSLADNGAQVLAPVLAGLLLLWLGIAGIMIIDLVTFFVALGSLLLVRIPAPVEAEPPSRMGQELRVGLAYIRNRPGLMTLTTFFMAANFFATITYFSTLPAMILARSGNDELALAWVQAALGTAGVGGALVISLWGGPRRKIHGVLAAAALSFLAGDLTLSLGQSLPVWVTGALISAFFVPIIGGCNDAIWQAKVPPALQGRVFAGKAMLGHLLAPAGYLLGGLLAEQYFEPAMRPGGDLAALFGGLVGTGPGAGIALMFAGVSLLGGAMSLAGYLVPALRNVEEELPDQVQEHPRPAATLHPAPAQAGD